MLQVREHAGGYVLEFLARLAGHGGADAAKIIVARGHAAGGAGRPPEGEIIGLDQHLEEGVVPAHADALQRRARNASAYTPVKRGEVGKAPIDPARRMARSVALLDELQQHSRLDAFGNGIVSAGDDRRQARRRPSAAGLA
jgi:hypothetical protein